MARSERASRHARKASRRGPPKTKMSTKARVCHRGHRETLCRSTPKGTRTNPQKHAKIAAFKVRAAQIPAHFWTPAQWKRSPPLSSHCHQRTAPALPPCSPIKGRAADDSAPAKPQNNETTTRGRTTMSETPKKPKATKAIIAQRVEEILRVRLDGAEFINVREYVREKERERVPPGSCRKMRSH